MISILKKYFGWFKKNLNFKNIIYLKIIIFKNII